MAQVIGNLRVPAESGLGGDPKDNQSHQYFLAYTYIRSRYLMQINVRLREWR